MVNILVIDIHLWCKVTVCHNSLNNCLAWYFSKVERCKIESIELKDAKHQNYEKLKSCVIDVCRFFTLRITFHITFSHFIDCKCKNTAYSSFKATKQNTSPQISPLNMSYLPLKLPQPESTHVASGAFMSLLSLAYIREHLSIWDWLTYFHCTSYNTRCLWDTNIHISPPQTSFRSLKFYFKQT